MPDSNHEKEGSDAAADCDDDTVLEISPSYFQVNLILPCDVLWGCTAQAQT